MPAPFWGDIDPIIGLSLWDTITLGGIAMGGIPKVTAHKGGRIDPKSEPGTDGAEFTHLGFSPTQIMISIRMWLPQHLATWEALVNYVEGFQVPGFIGPSARNSRDPVDVDHPALALHGVRSIYIMTMEPPIPTGEPQIFEARITGQEWKPKKKMGTGVGLHTADKSRSKINQQRGALDTQPKPPPSKRSTGP